MSVYRKQNEAFKGKNTFPAVNMGEVHWCFGVAVLPLALGTLNVCMASWKQEITKACWSAIINPVSESWVSVDGYGSCSRTRTTNALQKSTQEWFKTKRWTVLTWPAMSPNLNPIEHLWGDLKTADGRRHPFNLGELEQFAQEEWAKLPGERSRKLIHGYRKCLTTVILSKGCATKY